MKVEITDGFNGTKVLYETQVASLTSATDVIDVYARYDRRLSRCVAPHWTYTIVDKDVTIVDFGSHTVFGRITQ